MVGAMLRLAGDDDRGPGYRADAYGETFADVYDDWYEGVTDAAATASFVAARCGSGPVLELGVGTGRLAQPLSLLGLEVVGVDASAAMLRRCAGRPFGAAVRLVRADMAAIPLRGRFGAVLIGFNTLFNLPTAAAQGRLFAEIRPLVGSSGVVIVEAEDGRVLASGPRRSIGVRTRSAEGLTVVGTVLDPESQTITGQHVELTAGGARFRPWSLRWATAEQIGRYAAAAGLRLVERYSDWGGTAYSAASDSHISVFGADLSRP
jgi:SAM-dependent methyltransferase